MKSNSQGQKPKYPLVYFCWLKKKEPKQRRYLWDPLRPYAAMQYSLSLSPTALWQWEASELWSHLDNKMGSSLSSLGSDYSWGKHSKRKITMTPDLPFHPKPLTKIWLVQLLNGKDRPTHIHYTQINLASLCWEDFYLQAYRLLLFCPGCRPCLDAFLLQDIMYQFKSYADRWNVQIGIWSPVEGQCGTWNFPTHPLTCAVPRDLATKKLKLIAGKSKKVYEALSKSDVGCGTSQTLITWEGKASFWVMQKPTSSYYPSPLFSSLKSLMIF